MIQIQIEICLLLLLKNWIHDFREDMEKEKENS